MNKWQAQGFGIAPFTCIGMFQMPNKETATMSDYQALPRMSKGGVGTCHVCGTGIVYNYMIRDAKGDTFVVGCDCAGKTGDEVLKREIKQAKRVVRDAARIAELLKIREEREAERKANAEIVKEKYGELFDKADALNQPWIDDIIASCLKWGSVSEKQAAALQSAIERAEAEKARKNEYFSEVGRRVEVELTVDFWKLISFDEFYRTSRYLVKCRDAEGRTFIYFGDTQALPPAGDTVKLKVTIKEHQEYNGVFQTIFQRPAKVNKK